LRNFRFAALLAAVVLAGCSSLPKSSVLPTAVPEKVPLFVIDGNPLKPKTFHVVLDGVPIMDVQWLFSGTSPTDSSFHFPPGTVTEGRQTLFYEVSAINLTAHPIRLIQGSSSDTSWVKSADGEWKQVNPNLILRADVKDTISVYDIAASARQTRRNYYAMGPIDGGRPYREDTYIYWVEGLDKWFAVKYVRGGPDKE
jgi:hypothetical protein